MEQKNKIHDLEERLARLEAIINSSLIVDGNTNNGFVNSRWKHKQRTIHKKARGVCIPPSSDVVLNFHPALLAPIAYAHIVIGRLKI